MKTYAKGVRWEREILHYLNHLGFSVIRSASSGSRLYPLDVLAIKSGFILAIECKYSDKMIFKKNNVQGLVEWAKRAGAIPLLAWKKNGKWLFTPAKDWLTGNEFWIELHDLLKAIT
ncbi:MAG: hypothetical protein QXP39_02920 [Candidatus Aenigmatarchaeota archaeon]